MSHATQEARIYQSSASYLLVARLAQSVEQRTSNPEVVGSNPTGDTCKMLGAT